MSFLKRIAPLPAECKALITAREPSMCDGKRSSSEMPSLKEMGVGAERFMQGRMEPSGFSTAMRPLILEDGRGGESKGPATTP